MNFPWQWSHFFTWSLDTLLSYNLRTGVLLIYVHLVFQRYGQIRDKSCIVWGQIFYEQPGPCFLSFETLLSVFSRIRFTEFKRVYFLEEGATWIFDHSHGTQRPLVVVPASAESPRTSWQHKGSVLKELSSNFL